MKNAISHKNVISPEIQKLIIDQNQGPLVYIHLFGTAGIAIKSSGSDKLESLLDENNYRADLSWRIIAYASLKYPLPVKPREIEADLHLKEPCAAKNIRSAINRINQKILQLAGSKLFVSTPVGYIFNPEFAIVTDYRLFEQLDKRWIKLINVQTPDDVIFPLSDNLISLYTGRMLQNHEIETWYSGIWYIYTKRYREILDMYCSMLYGLQDSLKISQLAQQAIAADPKNLRSYYWQYLAAYQAAGKDMADKILPMAEKQVGKEEMDRLYRWIEEVDCC